MNRLLVAAIAAVIAVTSLGSVAEARGRGEQWHNSGQHQGWNRGWNGRYAGWRGRHYGWRGRNYGWRYNRWHDHNGYYGYNGWYGGYYGYYGYPGYYDDYCFVKKVRRYDAYGNMYIKRKRVCR